MILELFSLKRSAMDNPAVAQINKQFFALSETFIYFYLSRLKKYHPICYGWREQTHQELFPFPGGDCYSIEQRLSKWGWFARGVIKRILNLSIDREIFKESFVDRRIKIIHSHFGPVGWWALDLKKTLNLPLITSFYGYDLGDRIRDFRGWPARRLQLFEQGDLFLVEGQYMRERLIQLGCSPEKIRVQRIAIPVEDIPFRLRSEKRNERIRFLFSGRFVEKKGVMDILATINFLILNGEDVELFLIGDGPLMARAIKFIKKFGLGERIRFLGKLPYQRYLQEMNRADIFIHPSCISSTGDSEGGAPTTILEAQACGLPVISTTHADIPNVVVPGSSAILVGEHQVEELVKVSTELIHHPERWGLMGKAGRKFVEENHDINKEVRNLEAKYDAILETKKLNA